MANKITKKDRFNQLLAIEAVAQNPELVEFINHELELLAKKNQPKEGEKKLTKEQQENLVWDDKVFEFLSNCGKTLSPADVYEQMDGIQEISIAKLRARLTSLAKSGRIVRLEDHRKVYYHA